MRSYLAPFALLALTACGSSGTGPTPPPPPSGNNNVLTARIDGQAFAASPLTITAGGNTSQLPGGLVFSGGTLTQPSRGLILSLGRIAGPGTYPLGVNNGTNAGGTLTMTFGVNSWWTPLDGDAGSITITSMANGRVAGHFEATLAPLAGGTGTVEVTQGQFNVPINPGYAAPAADDQGNTAEGSVGGMAWNGATIVGLGGGTDLVGFSAQAHGYLMVVSIGPPSVGTLPLQHTVPVRTITVSGSGGAGWATLPGVSGSITITSVTPKRIVGSLTGSLPGASGGASLAVDLDFNVRTAP
jgi:hypothetical protein